MPSSCVRHGVGCGFLAVFLQGSFSPVAGDGVVAALGVCWRVRCQMGALGGRGSSLAYGPYPPCACLSVCFQGRQASGGDLRG